MLKHAFYLRFAFFEIFCKDIVLMQQQLHKDSPVVFVKKDGNAQIRTLKEMIHVPKKMKKNNISNNYVIDDVHHLGW